MPTYLDAQQNYPGKTGPSRDWHAIAATEPQYRAEPWQIQAQRVPVRMTMKASRPVTQVAQAPAINLKRLPVSVRSSNQSPIEAGQGQQASTWRLSDPGWDGVAGGMLPGLGADDTGAGSTAAPGAMATIGGLSMPVLVGIGIVAGLLAVHCRKASKR